MSVLAPIANPEGTTTDPTIAFTVPLLVMLTLRGGLEELLASTLPKGICGGAGSIEVVGVGVTVGVAVGPIAVAVAVAVAVGVGVPFAFWKAAANTVKSTLPHPVDWSYPVP